MQSLKNLFGDCKILQSLKIFLVIAIALLGFLVTGSEPNFSNKNILAIHKRNQAKYSKGLGNTKDFFNEICAKRQKKY